MKSRAWKRDGTSVQLRRTRIMKSQSSECSALSATQTQHAVSRTP
jgi:hypothetical protein